MNETPTLLIQSRDIATRRYNFVIYFFKVLLLPKNEREGKQLQRILYGYCKLSATIIHIIVSMDAINTVRINFMTG